MSSLIVQTLCATRITSLTPSFPRQSGTSTSSTSWPQPAPSSAESASPRTRAALTDRAAGKATRHVVWITDNDTPMPIAQFSSPNDWRQACLRAFTRAKDASEMDIEIIPCFIPRVVDDEDGPIFDVTKFYDQLFAEFIPPAEIADMVRTLPDPFDGMEDKTTQLVSMKRAAFTVPFEIAPGTTIGVQGCVVSALTELTAQLLQRCDHRQAATADQDRSQLGSRARGQVDDGVPRSGAPSPTMHELIDAGHGRDARSAQARAQLRPRRRRQEEGER